MLWFCKGLKFCNFVQLYKTRFACNMFLVFVIWCFSAFTISFLIVMVWGGSKLLPSLRIFCKILPRSWGQFVVIWMCSARPSGVCKDYNFVMRRYERYKCAFLSYDHCIRFLSFILSSWTDWSNGSVTYKESLILLRCVVSIPKGVPLASPSCEPDCKSSWCVQIYPVWCSITPE